MTRLQALPQLTIVVNLTVKNDGARAVLIEDRLPAGFEIEYGQAVVRKVDSTVAEFALLIRATVMKGLLQSFDLRRSANSSEACDAAHRVRQPADAEPAQ